MRCFSCLLQQSLPPEIGDMAQNNIYHNIYYKNKDKLPLIFQLQMTCRICVLLLGQCQEEMYLKLRAGLSMPHPLNCVLVKNLESTEDFELLLHGLQDILHLYNDAILTSKTKD